MGFFLISLVFSVLILINDTFFLKMIDFLVKKLVKTRKNIYIFELEKLSIKKIPAWFQLEN